MNTVLVTGANGYIGSHVVRTLLNKNMNVVAADVNVDNIDSRAKVVKCNVMDICGKQISELFDNPDVCIHLAWQDGFNHNATSHMENLSSHFVFLKKIAESGTSQIAVMGTMHEIGYWEGEIREDTLSNPASLYGIAKNSLHRSLSIFLKDKGIVFQWLRAFYIYGNDFMNHSVFTKLLKAVENGDNVFPFNSGDNQYDFIHINELAEQIAACISQNQVSGVINCCSGVPTRLGDKVEQFILDNQLNITLQYGAFPDRPYDSPAVWGDATKIKSIMYNMGKRDKN